MSNLRRLLSRDIVLSEIWGNSKPLPRFEKKMIVKQPHLTELMSSLDSSLYFKKEEYVVKTQYFDTLDYEFLNEKNEGEVEKCKVRIRSYDCDPRSFLENKSKYGESGKKYRREFSTHREAQSYIKESPILSSLQETLYVEYKRTAYIFDSFNEKYRVTLDQGLTYFPPNREFSIQDDIIIFEIKFSEVGREQTRLRNMLSFYEEAVSKYSRGVRCIK